MITLSAAWVVPVDRPPIRNGRVTVNDGRIVAVDAPPVPDDRSTPIRDLGNVALLPGLVNAHTHIELSWMRGLVPPADAFTQWVRQLFAVRGAAAQQPDHGARVRAAAADAVAEMRATGTNVVADVSNGLGVVDIAAGSGLHGWVFHELIGFREVDHSMVERTRDVREQAAQRQTNLRIAVAAHAPYSVSPELFGDVRDEAAARGMPTTVHVGESAEELALLRDGTGEWAQLLRDLRVWRDDWTPPAVGPGHYIDGLGFWRRNVLAVHGVQLTDDELAVLRARQATLVTCPRSNVWVGVGDPPIARFYASGVDVAIGTDSLASVGDLNLFAELKAMRQLAPGVPAARLLESATLTGAHALGLDAECGSLTPGKRADIVAVSLPSSTDDVEAWLVSGVERERISWASQSRDTIA
ncbi:MAG: amidohydrolase family protein [Acidobacteria bacterium]|nr:amidohydrolase family protein [Acidobacteriota bacterium]